MTETSSTPRPETPRWRSVAAWCSYDFANSTYSAIVPAAVFGPFYAKVIVGNESGLGDFWWGAAIAASALLVAFTSPVMGAVADLSGARRKLFRGYTVAAVLGILMLPSIDPGDVLWGCLLFVLTNSAVEGAIVFYNAYLPEIVPARLLGRVSAWGFAAGYVGSCLGLAAVHGFVDAGRFDAVWLTAAVLFGIMAIPALLLLGPGGERKLSLPAAALHGWTHVGTLLREVLQLRDLRRFLLAYFVYVNGVNAAMYFAGNIGVETYGLDAKDIVVLFFLVQVSALIGALAMARATDRLGPKRVVQVSLLLWSVTGVTLAFGRGAMLFWGACVIAGLGLGTVQAASRAFMATLIPPGREDEFFGFYALCGKTASPLGAALFGVVSASTGSQRPAIFALTALYVGGFLLLRRVQGGGPTLEPPE